MYIKYIMYCEPNQGFIHMFIVSYKFIAPSWRNKAKQMQLKNKAKQFRLSPNGY